MSGPRVVVTGAGGFIGAAVCRAFAAQARAVQPWTRETGDLATMAEDALARALDGATAILHLAGRAHSTDATALRRDNTDATARLARAARRAGVARFVHASSVKVNGDWTERGRPFRPEDVPAPQDAYARSKRDAEAALFDTAAGSPMSAAALRLPLVYGPNAPGNFAALVAAVRAGRLLPLAAIDNRRHLLSVDNAAGAFAAALDCAQPLSAVHFVADADSVSTPDLVRAIAAALGVRARLIAIPVPLLRAAAALLGRGALADRLTRSIEVDSSSFTAATGWRPRPFHLDAATVHGASGP